MFQSMKTKIAGAVLVGAVFATPAMASPISSASASLTIDGISTTGTASFAFSGVDDFFSTVDVSSGLFADNFMKTDIGVTQNAFNFADAFLVGETGTLATAGGFISSSLSEAALGFDVDGIGTVTLTVGYSMDVSVDFGSPSSYAYSAVTADLGSLFSDAAVLEIPAGSSGFDFVDGFFDITFAVSGPMSGELFLSATSTANGIPEPGTLAMMLSGLLLVAGRRKLG